MPSQATPPAAGGKRVVWLCHERCLLSGASCRAAGATTGRQWLVRDRPPATGPAVLTQGSPVPRRAAGRRGGGRRMRCCLTAATAAQPAALAPPPASASGLGAELAVAGQGSSCRQRRCAQGGAASQRSCGWWAAAGAACCPSPWRRPGCHRAGQLAAQCWPPGVLGARCSCCCYRCWCRLRSPGQLPGGPRPGPRTGHHPPHSDWRSRGAEQQRPSWRRRCQPAWGACAPLGGWPAPRRRGWPGCVAQPGLAGASWAPRAVAGLPAAGGGCWPPPACWCRLHTCRCAGLPAAGLGATGGAARHAGNLQRQRARCLQRA